MKNKLIIFLMGVALCLILFSVVYSVTIFWTGFHNIDLGYNMNVMEKEFDTKLVDIGSDGQIRTGQELYRHGLGQIGNGFIMFGFFIFVFVAYLFFILVEVKMKEELQGGKK